MGAKGLPRPRFVVLRILECRVPNGGISQRRVDFRQRAEVCEGRGTTGFFRVVGDAASYI